MAQYLHPAASWRIMAKTGYQQWQWRNGGHLGCEMAANAVANRKIMAGHVAASNTMAKYLSKKEMWRLSAKKT
jgi:hypothetical protein